MKIIISFLLAVCLLCCTAVFSVAAENASDFSDLDVNFDEMIDGILDEGFDFGSVTELLPEDASPELLAYADAVDNLFEVFTQYMSAPELTDGFASFADETHFTGEMANAFVEALASICDTVDALDDEDYALLAQDDAQMAELLKETMGTYASMLEEMQAMVEPLSGLLQNSETLNEQWKAVSDVYELLLQYQEDTAEIFSDVYADGTYTSDTLALNSDVFDIQGLFDTETMTAQQYNDLLSISEALQTLSPALESYLVDYCGLDVLKEQVSTYVAAYEAAHPEVVTTTTTTAAGQAETESDYSVSPSTGADTVYGTVALALLAAVALFVSKRRKVKA